MVTMVEKVARAMWDARERRFPEKIRKKAPDNFDGGRGAWAVTAEMARAAIEAMRVPTLGMSEAGAEGSGEDGADAANGAWKAMIDAALKDG